MQSRGSNNRLSGMVVRSRISILMLSMFATMASLYVAGRLWQDAENRVYVAKELDRNWSVDDTLKIIACREQQKKLSALEMELVAARQEGFISKHLSETKNPPKKRPLVVIGILTSFGRKNNRDAIPKAWMATGAALKKVEDQNGIIVRFVIGRSATRGDSLDQGIDSENKQTDDFFILEDHVEALEELPKKTKLFFALAVEKWDAEFYAKVNNDVYVNIDMLGNTLAAHLDKPRVYIGCMKSGATDGMNQTGGSLAMGKRTSAMPQARWLSYPKLWQNLFQLTDLFFGLMLMMISALVPGSSVLMSNTLTKESFAAHLGHQELSVQEFEDMKLTYWRALDGAWHVIQSIAFLA